MIDILTDKTFKTTLSKFRVVLVHFRMKGSEHSKRIDTILEQVNNKVGEDVGIFNLIINDYPEIVDANGLTEVPVVKIFLNGDGEKEFIGAQCDRSPIEYLEIINSL